MCCGIKVMCTLVYNLISRTLDECLDVINSGLHKKPNKPCANSDGITDGL